MNLTKEQRTNYLIQEFCCTDYEKEEMKKWINDKGLEFVYDYVLKTFNSCERSTEK